jgi:galactokinase
LHYSELIIDKFYQVFGSHPQLSLRAPGRINLIGEHTDYNEGFVMPAGIDKAIYFCIGKRVDKKIIINAFDLKEEIELADITNFETIPNSWTNHTLGVIKEIQKLGFIFDTGINVCFGGDIPNGAGLSSSAAVESGFGFGLNELFDFELTTIDIALIAQKTEHNYVGVKCGIMDMFASLFSKENKVIKLDCKDLSFEYFPINLVNHQLVLVNSGVKHNLAESAYNLRREECLSGVASLKNVFPEINSLRDASLEQLDTIKDKINHLVYNRCRYIIEENQRVNNAAIFLKQGKMLEFGTLMKETHLGLSKLYEVSCSELDFLFENAITFNGILGSRMMGGGFGGCTINLIEKNKIHDFITFIKQKYKEFNGIDPACIVVEIGEGVGLI